MSLKVGNDVLGVSHYKDGKPIRYVHRIGEIELIVWLTHEGEEGQWRFFVRKIAYMQPIDKNDRKLMNEFTSIGYKAINILNKKK